jgi:hypothetical protein
MSKILQRLRIEALFKDPDYLLIEIKQDRMTGHYMLLFINHKEGKDTYCGTLTLERAYAAHLEMVLGSIDPTVPVKIKGSAL